MAVLVGTVGMAGRDAAARPSAPARHAAAAPGHAAPHAVAGHGSGGHFQAVRETRVTARPFYAMAVRTGGGSRHAAVAAPRGGYFTEVYEDRLPTRRASPIRYASYTSSYPVVAAAYAEPAALPPLSETVSRSSGGYGGSISCVPYARSLTGMAVAGNALAWWDNAAGIYARGARPEPGSVLNFRASGGMRMGHVAVVSDVVSGRELRIDHANWGGPGIRRGSVMHDVRVVDVSGANDWSAVRVQVGHDDGSLGRTYPTYGFIYNRPDNGTMLANSAPRGLLMNAGYRAATPAGGRYDEVAEAPVSDAAASRGYRY